IEPSNPTGAVMYAYLYIYEPPNKRIATRRIRLCYFDKWCRITKAEQDAMIKKITDKYPNLISYSIFAE
ncbi:hypothetical protein, partial [Xenorhabdus doucetiae]|uniref:hypothetical protein n=1 Tax=Xenorhabdus doucetiae TaxID=351671 RepID=UPI002B40D4C8